MTQTIFAKRFLIRASVLLGLLVGTFTGWLFVIGFTVVVVVWTVLDAGKVNR